MFNFPIGVVLESFRAKDTATALQKAADMGLDGVQIYTTRGPMAPENMTPQMRKDLVKMAADLGLTISALVGDFGVGFDNPENNPELIEKSKRVLDLAKDVGVNVVTTHIGVVPPDKNHPRYAIMQDACGELAEYADSMDGHFAIETGPETSIVLKGFLDGLHSRGVAVNLDPANLVMVTRDDPVQAVYNLKDYIVHTHAKDGNNLKPTLTPEEVYLTGFDHDNPDGPGYEEVPLGKGSVDFKAYLEALTDIGYEGFLTIEREVGENPESDIRLAMNYLRDLIGGK